MKSVKLSQLTFENFGHTLHHFQIESPDHSFLVYDRRNDDTKIGETSVISLLDTQTFESTIVYQTKNQTQFGPGVGAASFSPLENKIIFIHGIRNANKSNPYSATRRTGVAIDLKYPEQPIFMDARNITPPFTTGALRGGTHSHSWKKDKNWISFTYNDYILEQKAKHNSLIKDQRVVGMMFPKKVEVAKDETFENNSGEMFSIIVSKVVTSPVYGSNEIEKAFDECWIDSTNNIAFQGHVRNEKGKLKTEIFIATIPNEITFSENDDLLGTDTTLPNVPNCISQKRITFTENGISHFRHWLRSSPDGKIIYFLMEDQFEITQLFGVDLTTNKITQYSFLENSIASPFNLSSDGKYAVYFSGKKIISSDLSQKKAQILFDSNLYNNELTGIPHFSNDRKKIYFNQYVQNNFNKKFIQIFQLDIIF
ncbi:DUF3748 domain-containing protein [Empedobacter brevis]|uniref:DUF3748 domain-containing protein n=1 Tax=Empedobacter brevis TaxID=247 RepID=UPI0016247666|nr:DUF3748 domain-containing protein [Empedobacter brevis]